MVSVGNHYRRDLEVGIKDLQGAESVCQCGNSNLYKDYTTGDVVCTQCGIVLQNHVIAPQWSHPIKPNQGVLPEYGKKINLEQNAGQALQRALNLNTQKAWKEKKLLIGRIEIQRLIALHEMGSGFIESSYHLFVKATKQFGFYKHQIKLMAIVALYYTLRSNRYPVEWETLLSDFGGSPQLAKKYYQLLISELKLKAPEVDIAILVTELGNSLDYDHAIIAKTQKVVNTYLKSTRLIGFNRKGIVAGALHFVGCREFLPRKYGEIAKAAKVSINTVSLRSREINNLYYRQGIEI